MSRPLDILTTTWGKAGFPFGSGGDDDGCCIELEDGSGDILMEASNEVLTPVVWTQNPPPAHDSLFNAVLNGTTIARDTTPDFPANDQVMAFTTTTISGNGEGFEFVIPIPTTPGGVEIGLGPVPPTPFQINCGDNSTFIPGCGWAANVPAFAFTLNAAGTGAGSVRVDAALLPILSPNPLPAGAVYRIVQCNNLIRFYVNGVLVRTSSVPAFIYPVARLYVWVDYGPAQEPFVGDLISDAKKITNFSCANNIISGCIQPEDC
jgi:hypothetical protein